VRAAFRRARSLGREPFSTLLPKKPCPAESCFDGALGSDPQETVIIRQSSEGVGADGTSPAEAGVSQIQCYKPIGRPSGVTNTEILRPPLSDTCGTPH
jgi:hypothetical protein